MEIASLNKLTYWQCGWGWIFQRTCNLHINGNFAGQLRKQCGGDRDTWYSPQMNGTYAGLESAKSHMIAWQIERARAILHALEYQPPKS